MSGGLFALMSKKGREAAKIKELEVAFKKADKDGDGQLSQEEWMEVLRETGVEVSK